MSARKLSEPARKTDPRRGSGLREVGQMERLLVDIATELIDVPPERAGEAMTGALERIGRSCGADRAYVSLLSEEAGTLDRAYRWCSPELEPKDGEGLYGMPADKAKWLLGRLRQGEAVSARRLEELPAAAGDEREALGMQKMKSFSFSPLMSNGSLMGVLGIDTAMREAAWDQKTTDALARAAEMFARALHHKHTQERTRARMERMQSLRSIEMVVSSSLDLRTTVDMFIEQLMLNLDVDAADVLLLNPHTHALHYAGGRGYNIDLIRELRMRLGEDLAGGVALRREPLLLPDIEEASADSPHARLLVQEGFKSYAGFSLAAKGRIRGVLQVYSRTRLDPSREWLEFLGDFAEQAAIAIDNAALYRELQSSHSSMVAAYESTIEGWSRSLDYRDKEKGHCLRVTDMTLKVAALMGMEEEELVHVRRGALLHDVGKLGVPDTILQKLGALTEEEWTLIRQHPEVAYELLYPIEHLRPAIDIPYCHHERWDGSGYPRGIKGESVPLAARIFAVVDVWDVLHSERPYRKAWGRKRVRDYIIGLSGIQFDPRVVEVFLRVV